MGPFAAALAPLGVSNGDVILIVFFVALPVAGAVFVLGAGKALRGVGKGQFSVQFDADLPQRMRDSGAGAGSAAAAEVREEEIRQLLEAKAYRQSARGEAQLDVDEELARLLAEGDAAGSGIDAQLRLEVRQLVIARNERRERQGKEPLDVEAEIERQLRELESLGH